jgi:stearoyl-CoA desaturase (delta-9 desaturase)
MSDKNKRRQIISKRFLPVLRWIDSEAGLAASEDTEEDKKQVDWPRILPFILLHAGCLLVFWVGWSPVAVIIALVLYLVRMFAITGFYHRYFSHKAFKTNRLWQFVFALMGNASAQRGPLWWASHHRHHHRFADQDNDVHSPLQHGFWWSHIGWLTSRDNFPTRIQYVQEWIRFPELRWINRFDTVIPILLAGCIYLTGVVLENLAPSLGTNGLQLLIWGFFISTVVLLHATCTINSLDHMFGTRRYNTRDTSRNNGVLAILTLGEGWHNNHHRYAVSARQGFMWWELDITYGLLVLLSWLGVVRNLRPVPQNVLNSK